MSNSLMLQGNVMQIQLPFDFVKINFGIVMIRSLTVMIIVSTDASRRTRRGASEAARARAQSIATLPAWPG